MIETANVIVSFLLLPVTLFIVLPLVMLSVHTLFKLTLPLWTKRERGEAEEKSCDEVGHVTKAR